MQSVLKKKFYSNSAFMEFTAVSAPSRHLLWQMVLCSACKNATSGPQKYAATPHFSVNTVRPWGGSLRTHVHESIFWWEGLAVGSSGQWSYESRVPYAGWTVLPHLNHQFLLCSEQCKSNGARNREQERHSDAIVIIRDFHMLVAC